MTTWEYLFRLAVSLLLGFAGLALIAGRVEWWQGVGCYLLICWHERADPGLPWRRKARRTAA